MADVVDLKIVNQDFAFGADGEPLLLTDAEAIAQDVRHRLEESGLLVELVADDAGTASVLRRIAFAVEEDTRIQPGTVEIASPAPGTFNVTATTIKGALVETSVST